MHKNVKRKRTKVVHRLGKENRTACGAIYGQVVMVQIPNGDQVRAVAVRAKDYTLTPDAVTCKNCKRTKLWRENRK
jgi:hypothetical protein